MDFRDKPEEAAFRQEVRQFLKEELPDRFRGVGVYEGVGRNDMRSRFGELKEWRTKLADKGWIAPAWPQEYGGAGFSVMQQFIMNEEFAENRAPQVGGMGTSMIGPTLIVHGSKEQKQEHLSRILSGEVQWCQGFSEPESGSDLASLQTRAVRDGDDYVLNGQKIWTSVAQHAQWMVLMARTDPDVPKHKGISYFILDMKTPGITIRPLINLLGSAGFNEVFFEDVRVPKENLLGEENRGWYIGTTTLDFERSNIASTTQLVLTVIDLAEWAREHIDSPECTLARNPGLRYELADRAVEAQVARLMSYRVISMQNNGLIPNHEASVAKLYSSELEQRIALTAMKTVGLYGQLIGGEATLSNSMARMYLYAIAVTIGGGTSEIQRNIIAMRGLGMPRE